MSATGLDVFDKTIRTTTNVWLNEIMGEIGPDRRLAWHVLGAVLHALRHVCHTGRWQRISPLSCRSWFVVRIMTATNPPTLRTECGRWTNS